MSETEQLRQQVEVLRAHLSDDLYERLAIQHGWGHEPNNPQGVWCCDEHREAFYRGDLYGGTVATKETTDG
jgi:hypothetical protein